MRKRCFNHDKILISRKVADALLVQSNLNEDLYIDYMGRIYIMKDYESDNNLVYIYELPTGLKGTTTLYKFVKYKNKDYYVHHLVAHAFHENEYFTGATVDHKDGNSMNNAPINLRFCTLLENLMNPITYEKRIAAVKAYHRNKKLKTCSI